MLMHVNAWAHLLELPGVVALSPDTTVDVAVAVSDPADVAKEELATLGCKLIVPIVRLSAALSANG